MLRLKVEDRHHRRAHHEIQSRRRYVLNKEGDSIAAHVDRLLQGYLQEYAVSDWTRLNFPDLWLPASNSGIYNRPAGDDFRLDAEWRVLDVDVAGKGRGGYWGNVHRKLQADLHVCTEIVDRRRIVLIRGWLLGDEFATQRYASKQLRPFDELVGWCSRGATTEGWRDAVREPPTQLTLV